VDRLRPISGADDLVAIVSPFELAMQALVVLDDKQHGKIACFGHARFLSGSLAGSAAGSRMVKVVPRPRRLSTLIRPPIALIRERASNAPIPNPPALLDEKGWNKRLRTKSPSMPTPLSVMAIATLSPLLLTRMVTG